MENTTKTIKSRGITCLIALVAAILGVMLDQVTKLVVLSTLKVNGSFPLIKDVFELQYLENRGAAFGLFQNQTLFFYGSVLFITVVAIWFFLSVPLEKKFLPLQICAVLLTAGAFGNFIDRVRLGYVVDFFYFKLIDFPIFNVADIYVTVSTAVLFVLILFYYKEDDLERIIHRK